LFTEEIRERPSSVDESIKVFDVVTLWSADRLDVMRWCDRPTTRQPNRRNAGMATPSWYRSERAATLAMAMVAWVMTSAGGGPAQAKDGGSSYWMMELDLGWGAGIAFPEGPSGLKTGVALGVGGAPRGSPLRFNFMLHIDLQELSASDISRAEPTTISRTLIQTSIGLRVGSMFSARARAFFELGLGHLFVDTRAELGGGRERLKQSDDSFVLTLALGAQYRFHQRFSLGARMDFTLPTGLRGFDALAEMAGADGTDGGAMNLDWVLTTTFHF